MTTDQFEEWLTMKIQGCEIEKKITRNHMEDHREKRGSSSATLFATIMVSAMAGINKPTLKKVLRKYRQLKKKGGI